MWCEGWPVNSWKEIFLNLINIFFSKKECLHFDPFTDVTTQKCSLNRGMLRTADPASDSNTSSNGETLCSPLGEGLKHLPWPSHLFIQKLVQQLGPCT